MTLPGDTSTGDGIAPQPAFSPLTGVRILSFEAAVSLPSGTRLLAELGAEVVRVVPPQPGEAYIGIVDGVFLSKQCIALNLSDPRGQDLARRLAQAADVVSYNFRPHVMQAFQLAPDDLLDLRSDLIVLQLTGYGTPGPWADFGAFGPSTEAAGGLNALMGNEGDPPVRVGSGVFADQLSGRWAALGLIAALERRRRTGEGMVLDLSMAECVTALMGLEIVKAQAGVEVARQGNRHPLFAPQGIYPCRGDDHWIAISVTRDDEWHALVDVVGDARLRDPMYATVSGRRDAHDAIDASLAIWTSARGKDVLAAELQARGIPSAPVRHVDEPYFDPHLVERGSFDYVQHTQPIAGFMSHPHLALPWRVTGFGRRRLGDYRYVGWDNASVLERWLGIGPAEVDGLETAGVLGRSERFEFVHRPPAQGARVDGDAGERLGLTPAEGSGR